MVTKSRFTYLSRDGIHKCQAYKWQNDNVPVKGILQIIHGMQEHMERYDEFASFMCDNGFIVVGNDHLGHGLTVLSEELGYFAKDNADVIVVRDVHRLKKMTEGEYPGLPYFILGHSMGSFIARKYLTMYGKVSVVQLSAEQERSLPLLQVLVRFYPQFPAFFKGT